MSRFELSRNLQSGMRLFLCSLIVWALTLSIFHTLYRNVLLDLPSLFFCIGAAFWTFLIFELSADQQSLRLAPRRSDLLIILLVLPLSGSLQFVLMEALGYHPNISAGALLLYAPPLAMLLVLTHLVGVVWPWLKKRRRKIVLCLQTHERQALLHELEGRHLNDIFEVLSMQQFKEFLLQGRARELDLIVVSRLSSGHFDSDPTLLRAHTVGIPMVDFNALISELTGRISLDSIDLWTYLQGATRQTAARRLFSAAKRVIEPLVAFILMILLSPLLLIIALAVRAGSTGPVLYRQVRCGLMGKQFTLYKFRSMHEDAEANGPQWAMPDDSRSTPLGNILRQTRLDELPQLWNVVKGEMSFFGPRPERPEIYCRLQQDIPLFSLRTVVPPGISGWAQVHYGYTNTVEEARFKLEYDLYYIQHMSLRLDLIILMLTFGVLGRGRRGLEGINSRERAIESREAALPQHNAAS